jgi:amidase
MSNSLIYKSATELVKGIKAKEYSVKEVVISHLKRIKEVNPYVNAIVNIEEDDILKKAEIMDANFNKNISKYPLLGLPIAIKDTHNVIGFKTTFGSKIYSENYPNENEISVERMLEAGAIVIGKTNVPEFAAGSHTFNKIFGTTYNPYDLTKTAGGSSGGAAAALATGMIALADGSDMGGSCRNPAAYNNVVGLRPSPGLIPIKNKNLIYSPLSVQGPLARNVEDLTLMLSVMAGRNKYDPLSYYSNITSDILSESKPLKNIRIAYSADLGGSVPISTSVRKMFNRQLDVFNNLGCFLEEDSIDFTNTAETFQILRANEFALSYEDIYLLDKEKYIKETVRWNIKKGVELKSSDIRRAEKDRSLLYNKTNIFFEKYDFLITPVSQVQPFDAGIEYPTEINGNKMNTYIDWMESCSIITVTGCPAISIPAGFAEDGLPFGLQIIAPFNQDISLLKIAFIFEQATKHGLKRPSL